MKNTKKLVLISLLGSLGAIIGLFEQMMPLPFMVPGFRLGFSNIVVLVGLISFGYKSGFVISLLKSILLMLLSGNVSSFIYSFSGAFLSACAMIMGLKFGKKFFSLIGISILGSSFHNIAQVAVSSIILNNIMMFSYLSILLIIGIFTGFFVGLSSNYICKNLESIIDLENKEWIL
ncbi:Gx transporter family protein [Neofamilia massiliensis]|uniref:Gx transporter family protein n=1 Tax=Neofamilia massiliensis TaxID=1673724 RepID=UPI0006BB8DF4|nr:Gx transporter family protein [Neofamilia massiliensis]